MNDTPFDQDISAPETVVGATVKIQGDLNSDGNIRIDGQVKGTVSTKQNVQIGESAVITANVSAGSATVEGKIQGNLKIVSELVLQKSAQISGDIECSVLIVEAGATFNGKCAMGSQLTTQPTNTATEEDEE